jgi:2-isopropylmalate synthase
VCDTNGGTLPHDAERIVAEVAAAVPDAALGCHFHNDSGTAVANSLAAVRAGVVQVQGCMNGYGERTGNADLCAVIPNVSLKMGIPSIPQERISRLTRVSHHIAEIVNLTLDDHLPFVGTSAFTHKAGLHTSALARRPDAYEHLSPTTVGNTTRTVVSELAGRSTILAKARDTGLDLSPDEAQAIVDRIKELEHEGYHFEAADGSFELLARDVQGWKQPFFDLESYRVFVEHRDDVVTAEATVKVVVDGERVVTTREGDGPVAAIDGALRAALCHAYPHLANIRLVDYRVRDLDSSDGAAARVRVLCRHSDSDGVWGTIGVHQNIIDASWKAVCEGLVIGLLRRAESSSQEAPTASS